MTIEQLISGFSDVDLSESVRPQDDLFHYVNGRWIDETAIPAEYASYGTFLLLFEEAERNLRAIVDEVRDAAPGSESRKVGDLYGSFLDEERVNARGAEPLVAPLARVKAITTYDDLFSLLGEFQGEGLAALHQLFVENDPGDPSRYVVFFEQAGLSLPDESYYREAHFADVRDALVRHVENMFVLAGVDAAAARAARVVGLETELAARHWDNVASRDSVKTYNLLTWAATLELFANAPSGALLDRWRAALGAPSAALDEVVLRQPSFTASLGELLTTERLESWRDWLAWRVIHADAPYLAAPFVDEHFDFFGRTLTGAETLRERWKRALALVEGAMGEAVGKIYVERHFPPNAKARVDELVANLVEAYRQSISSLEWMGPATRERALAKLDAFTPKIGYPVRWRDYSALAVDPDDLIANVRAANVFEFRRNLAKIGQPVDRDEWFMTPQMINAYYNPGFNEIVFPAAIIQPPFFDVTRDDAANYGGIGAVIGHEIGHGFDDQGSKFDGEGRLQDWWDASDREAFETRTRALIEQYDALAPSETPDQHVNGALTVGENIGDLGGLGIAWQAYRLSLGGAEAPVIDGLSGAQRFFLAWGLGWRHQSRPEEALLLLASDPHSPPEFRVNQIVRNLDAYYAAFDVRPTDASWLEPAARVVIW